MIVSISGYNYTGTGALMDLLQEYEEVYMHPSELMLIDLPDGIRDLDFHLNGPGTYFNGDLALRRFRNFAIKLTAGKCCANPEIVHLTDAYVDALTDFSWTGLSSNDGTYLTGSPFFFWGFRHYFRIFLNKLTHHTKAANLRTMRVGIRGEAFLFLTQQYLQQVAYAIGGREGKINAFNHLVPSCDPESLKYLPNGRLIMLTRDPRDIYVLAKKKRITFSLPFDDVKTFVSYFKRECLAHIRPLGENEICVHFEDLIFDYENTVQKIELFLGLKRSELHRTKFNPDVSIKNTQIYGRLPELKDDIAYIERELAPYLYPFPEKPQTEGDFF